MSDLVEAQDPVYVEGANPVTSLSAQVGEQAVVAASHRIDIDSKDKNRAGEALVPEWAEQPFQVLMIKVNGLTLAVPLVHLSGLLKWTGKASRMPGQPDWHLGVSRYRNRTYGIVDIARILMLEPLEVDAREISGQEHLLMVGEGGWGLLCDGLLGTITLTKAEVQWRARQGKSPWLAGTVVSRLCAVIEIGAILDIIGHS